MLLGWIRLFQMRYDGMMLFVVSLFPETFMNIHQPNRFKPSAIYKALPSLPIVKSSFYIYMVSDARKAGLCLLPAAPICIHDRGLACMSHN